MLHRLRARQSRRHPLTTATTLAAAASLAVAGALGGGAVSAGSASAARTTVSVPIPALPSGNYVVILRDKAVSTYDGSVAGLPATKPAEGTHLNARLPAVARYQRYLQGRQDATLRTVGATARYRYTAALNGFSADLDSKQATTLSSDRDVLAVVKDTARKFTTVSSPAFLGLSGPGGLWSLVGGPRRAGHGIVVADLDTGIWPESRSFAGRALARGPGAAPYVSGDTPAGPATAFRKSDGQTFTGLCQLGEDWTPTDCNQKLISARYYDNGYLANVPVDKRPAFERLSARDGDGHGSHTASTAAGNAVPHVTIDGTDFGTASGMAPGAKIAAYKVCFSDNDETTGDCYGSDSVAAIDQAVLDGVDVINYSISGAVDTVVDPVEYAFFDAAAAGIFVATSAGNDGPTPSTVAHPSPWVTSVAASTSSRLEGTVVTGDGRKYKGASISRTPVPSTPLALSTDVGAGSAAVDDARLCAPGSLDPAKVSGKMVLCDRGVIDRTAKSAEVQRAGGVAMILANTSLNSLDADVHSVPTVHVDAVAGAAIKGYVNGAGAAATASLDVGDTTGGAPTPLPQLAGFSSRGPSLSAGGDILKPDVAAPGVSIIAAVAPPNHQGRDYDVESGTSMASPHIAGLAALVLSASPTLSPSAVKSVLMTTAYDTKNADGSSYTDPFGQGAGEVNPRAFLRAGLLVTSTPTDWARFYAGQGLQLGSPDAEFTPLDGTDLNQPSIAVGALAGSQTVERTFTGVLPGRYRVSVDVPGFSTTTNELRPFLPGQQQTLSMTFTRTTAVLGQWATGFVHLEGPFSSVRLPVALRPIAVSAPGEVHGSAAGGSGSVDVTIRSGTTGSLPLQTVGLAPGVSSHGSLAPYGQDSRAVVVPAGTRDARFQLDTADNAADFDLYVFRLSADGTTWEGPVAQSATASADESVDLADPSPGTYVAVVDGYANAPGHVTDDYTLTTYVVSPDTSTGTFTAAPNPLPVVQGQNATYTLSWSGIRPTRSYLGWVGYGDATSPTLVAVDGAP